MSESASRYAVRILPRADRDAIDALLRLEEIEGEDVAQAWYAGLRAAVVTLAEQPLRYAVLPRESRLVGRDVRRLLYRRTPGSAAYLVYYVVDDAGVDGPRVLVFHVRHAARKPLTASEGRELQGDL